MKKVTYGEAIDLVIWRRGRGRIDWRFQYVYKSDEPWFTTPGWYRQARKNVYRLTIDHDYPHKPLWLGVRKHGEWYNAETLYSPLSMVHKNLLIQSRNIKSKRRSAYRQRRTKEILFSVVNRTFAESTIC